MTMDLLPLTRQVPTTEFVAMEMRPIGHESHERFFHLRRRVMPDSATERTRHRARASREIGVPRP